MSILLPTLLAATVSASDRCAWDDPGRHRFTGDPVAAVDHYLDIPAAVRDRLKARMQAHRYDEIVEIRRDAVIGQQRYHPVLTDMHFGRNRVCRAVTRQGWAPERVERGLVYCDSGHCLVLPTVCSNLSRIQRLDDTAALGERGDGPLAFDPPGAGPSFAALSSPAAAGLPGAAAPGSATTDTGVQPAGLPGDAPAADALPGLDVAGPATPADDGWTDLPDTAPPGAVDPVTGEPTSPPAGAPPGAGPGGPGWGPGWPGWGPGGTLPPGFFEPDAPWSGRPVVPPPVPEPATWLLWGLGIAALAARLRPRPHGRGDATQH